MKAFLRATVFLLVCIFTGFQTHASDKVYFYYTDPAGTPLAMTNNNGAVVWQAEYLPFGEVLQETPYVVNDRKFVGKEQDLETDLYYFGARYMEARLGRFFSPDPIGPVDPITARLNDRVLQNPQELNVYTYSVNNPYRYFDPDGNETRIIMPNSERYAERLSAFPPWLRGLMIALDMPGPLPMTSVVVGGEATLRALAAPEVANPWVGEIVSEVATGTKTMYRVWGGKSFRFGEWLTPIRPTSAVAARESLALPAKNTAEYVSEVIVPAGTRYQIGRAASRFGHEGGGIQVLLLEGIPFENFGIGTLLAP